MSLEINPYEVLGVERDANEETIKKAYRRLAKKWHPDTYKGTDKEYAECKFKEINEAGDILLNPENRAKYDLEHPLSVNVYEYYAKKQEPTKPKTKAPKDIEKEKQRIAVLDFLNVEYNRKGEILDMFLELATGAVDDTYSEEEYEEMLELLLAEQMDCITKIQEIIKVARQRRIEGLNVAFGKAEEVIEELTQVAENTPKSLKEAKYKEETRILKEKIDNLVSKLGDRIESVEGFNILEKTWEFENDNQLKSALKRHRNRVNKLLKDIEWIEKTASERNIEVELIKIYSREITIDTCKQRVEKCNLISNLNLQQLREEFWKNECYYTENSAGEKILREADKNSSFESKLKGNFICPPGISGISFDAFYWLKNIESISIPAKLVNEKEGILFRTESLRKLIFDFGTHSQIIDISQIGDEVKVIKKGDYICIYNGYIKRITPFVLLDANNVYIYDDKKLCELSGVTSVEELKKSCDLWEYTSISWKDYQLQIHAWAQVTKRLPDPYIMKLLPTTVEAMNEWSKWDKTNYDKAIAVNDSLRVVRLYFALGALKGEECHAQAERLISKLDVGKMYRSRFERHPEENKGKPDPMFSVPKQIVDFIEANINNKDFLPYIFAFLENHKLFLAEAKKAGVKLSPEFIIATALQCIFHTKCCKITDFEKQLLENERNIDSRAGDKILRIHRIVQTQLKNGKNFIETVDTENNSKMHYKYVDIKSLQTYLIFAKEFKVRRKIRRSMVSRYAIEAENVFLSSNSHAIEIVNEENRRIAIVILNLLDEGELFADIMSCNIGDADVDVLETIRRALIDQKRCNYKVKGISIGMSENPFTDRFNIWRDAVAYSDSKWLEKIEWIKFEYLFKTQMYGDSYKGYRARFMLEGKEQKLNPPNPHINPYVERDYRRRHRHW